MKTSCKQGLSLDRSLLTPIMAHTYTRAGAWTFDGVFTTQDVARLCTAFANRLGPGHVIIPEAIREGGLEWLDWPGKLAHEYKAVRFVTMDRQWKWPHVDSAGTRQALTDWEQQPPRAICGPNGIAEATFFFKAFHGAPVWTFQELQHLQGACLDVGMWCELLPDLVQHGDLGVPPH